jgi:hypothetical protein
MSQTRQGFRRSAHRRQDLGGRPAYQLRRGDGRKAAKEGGECVPFAADVTKEDTLAAADCRRRGALGTDPGEPVSPGSVGFSAGMVETDLTAFDAATTEEASAALELGIAMT